MLAHHSPEFVQAAKAAARDADVVVFSHPWVYPLVGDALGRPGQLVVYDAHNVESVLRYRLLADSEIGLRIVRHGTAVERELCRRADLVLTCSHEDRDLFHRLYEIPFGKVPRDAERNIRRRAPPRESARRDEEAPVGAGRQTARDVSSAACIHRTRKRRRSSARNWRRHCRTSASRSAAGSGSAVDRASLARRGIANVHVTGVVDDTARRDYLGAADVAVNPMFSGSGTNIKMFDFMAAGLPVISTPTGARGIKLSGSALHVCARAANSPARCDRCSPTRSMRGRLGAAARRLACESYSWERLSPRLGRLLTRHRTARRAAPCVQRHRSHLRTSCASADASRLPGAPDVAGLRSDPGRSKRGAVGSPGRILVARHPLRAHGPEGHEPRAQSRRVARTRRRARLHRRRLPAGTGLAARMPRAISRTRTSLAWKGWSSPIASTTRTTAP